MLAFATKTRNSGSHLRKKVDLKSEKWRREQEISIMQRQSKYNTHGLI